MDKELPNKTDHEDVRLIIFLWFITTYVSILNKFHALH